MKTLSTSFALLAVLAVGLGCRQGGTDIAATTQRVKDQHTGPEQHLIDALYALDLRPDQRQTLDGLVTDAQVRLLPVKQAMADLMREAAKEIRKGEVNEERLRILAENLKGEFFKTRPGIIAILNQVHKTLDKAQREQLVNDLRAKHRARMAEHQGEADGDRPGFHGHGSGHGPGHMRRGRHRLKRLAEKLGLSKTQRGKIRDAIQKGIAAMHEKSAEPPKDRWEKRREQMHAAVRSFLSEDFDAAKLPLLDKPHGPGLEKLDKILKLGKHILPVLKAEQRAQIAYHLEFRADLIAPAAP